MVLAFDRSTMRAALLAHAIDDGSPPNPLDLLVIGGGITGAGVALDAAARGLRVAVIERDDFASGTSSKSSKLIHGGLRYLQNGDVRLVYQALRERRRLMRNAPHLVSILPFLIPVTSKDGVVSKKVARALGSAMWMYDATGGWRIGKLHRRISGAEAARHFPTTRTDRLAAGYLYYDAAADDARLTLTIARTAAAHGAITLNRCAAVGIEPASDGAGSRFVVSVEADGERHRIATRSVVNAAGVWADQVRALDERHDPQSIRPAKGVHVTIPWDKTRNDIAVIIPVRRDKRSLFLVPWIQNDNGTFRYTYVGTTDTDHAGGLDDAQCDDADVDYVLEALNQALTTHVERSDLTGVWAGLRPLAKAASSDAALSSKSADMSRQHRVDVGPNGVVRVTGGKLTTYREMAEDAVDRVVEQLDGPVSPGWLVRLRSLRRRHPTRRMPLDGATTAGGPTDLERRYGSRAAEVRALVTADAALGDPLVPGLPYLRAEAVYAARHEMATTLDDVLCRRTRAHLADRRACVEHAADVAALLASEFGWDAADQARQVDAYLAICAAEEAALVAPVAEVVP